MRKIPLSAGVVLFLLLSIAPSANATVKSGSTCSTLNQISISSGVKYTCIKLGKKRVWSAGIKVQGMSTATQQQSVAVLPVQSPGSLGGNSDRQATSTIPAPINKSCTDVNAPGVTVDNGVLYCVKMADNSNKYIEFYKTAPVINNPPSLDPLTSCETPDLRGPVPVNMDPLAITYPASTAAWPVMHNSGNFNIAVVPIDFSDAPGGGLPSDLYGDQSKLLADWFNAFSNGKLHTTVQFIDKWHRASKPSSTYNVGGGEGGTGAGESPVVQEYVDLSKNEIDYTKVDTVIFVYPKDIPAISDFLTARNDQISVNGRNINLLALATSQQTGKYGLFWVYMAHEMLHSFGLAMHFPVNPPGWGIEWGNYTHSETLSPWNQMILGWLNSDQYYCATGQDLTDAKLTLVPLESEASGMRTAFIRVSNTESLMVVSHRKDIWSYNMPDSYYGTMVALIDTSKQNDWSGESGADPMDGVKFSRTGVWLHPVNSVAVDHTWNPSETADWGARMYLGDSITYKGVTVKLIASNNFDTVEISKS